MYSFSDILQYGLLYLTDQRGAAAIVFSVLGICIVGYLLGGINFSIIVSKVRYKDDIRKHGSGNAGLTNMLRTYGKGAAAATLIGDVLKTILPCFIGSIVLLPAVFPRDDNDILHYRGGDEIHIARLRYLRSALPDRFIALHRYAEPRYNSRGGDRFHNRFPSQIKHQTALQQKRKQDQLK